MEYIYAGLLIHKLGSKINEATVKKVIEATTQPVVTAQAVVERKEEKKEEKEEESKEAAAGLGALFG